MDQLGFSRMLDWKVHPVAPLTPRSKIISNVGITDEAQRQIRVSRAITTMTVRNDFLLRNDSLCFIHLLQFISRFHEAAGIEIIRPFEVNGAGNRPAPSGTNPFAGIFIISASIDDD